MAQASLPAVKVETHAIEIQDPDRILFPGDEITRRDLVEYYYRMGSILLPHVQDRVLAFESCPLGVRGPIEFVVEPAGEFPEWMERSEVELDGRVVRPLVARDAATVVYAASRDLVTPHVFLSRVDEPDQPDWLFFDVNTLRGDWRVARSGTIVLGDLLESLGLTPLVRTSGSVGYHVMVPLTGELDFEAVQEFARRVSACLARRKPERFTVDRDLPEDEERAVVGWERNARGRFIAATYAIRARTGAPVATPLEWKELRAREIDPCQYNLRNIFRRLSQKQDPWADWAGHRQDLEPARRRLHLVESSA